MFISSMKVHVTKDNCLQNCAEVVQISGCNDASKNWQCKKRLYHKGMATRIAEWK